jgi:hypothetical protein
LNKYEIRYEHSDMPKDYLGKTCKWARDEKQAISFLCTSKPNKQGHCTTKKGARLKIISVECIYPQTKLKSSEMKTTQDSAQFFLEN